ncbi:MAG: ATP-binding cassette domain-containing protein [Rhizobiales bacterium]|nr:ATP-binding cassette domain-containing protein [Hyphomicrobiales bacterium]
MACARRPKGRWKLHRGRRGQRQKLHQDPASAFAPHLTFGRQLRDLRRLMPEREIRSCLPQLLARFHLDWNLLYRRPDAVSGGEAQRLALCRLLLMSPSFVVADEPTSRLDDANRALVVEVLLELVTAGRMALVLIAHDDAVVSALADHLIRIGSD